MDKITNEYSMEEDFKYCAEVVRGLDNGTLNGAEVQERMMNCYEKLKRLAREVSALSLFSNNEVYDDLPTSSMKYLFVTSYQAIILQNKSLEPQNRVKTLRECKALYREFLSRLRSYNVIGDALPWDNDIEDDDEENRESLVSIAPAVRKRKQQNVQKERELTEKIVDLEGECNTNPDDDSALRELLLNRLRLAALKAMNELEMIDMELPLAELMAKVKAGEAEPPPRPSPQQKQIPFIITRDTLQKSVFGKGYPSLPTVSVGEWYEEMMKTGGFNLPQPGSSHETEVSDDEKRTEEQEDLERARLQRWDEYKDTHRRGWGNKHNKG